MMPPLIVALMMTALSAEGYTTGTLKSLSSEDHTILKVLRDLRRWSALPSAKILGNAVGGFPKAGWWITKVVFPQTTNKRQDVSSYNLNSFGLRYGK
ncbi:metastasis-suppressor KiSS-1 [Odontesthes bonariensis]|uniref:metastasis-suppressor KiSS-1 n=1 Tax=Odontesthes bonariensis TaxID=219752 RepID=UPI003F58296F